MIEFVFGIVVGWALTNTYAYLRVKRTDKKWRKAIDNGNN